MSQVILRQGRETRPSLRSIVLRDNLAPDRQQDHCRLSLNQVLVAVATKPPFLFCFAGSFAETRNSNSSRSCRDSRSSCQWSSRFARTCDVEVQGSAKGAYRVGRLARASAKGDQPVQQCAFCDGNGSSRTHIWEAQSEGHIQQSNDHTLDVYRDSIHHKLERLAVWKLLPA